MKKEPSCPDTVEAFYTSRNCSSLLVRHYVCSFLAKVFSHIAFVLIFSYFQTLNVSKLACEELEPNSFRDQKKNQMFRLCITITTGIFCFIYRHCCRIMPECHAYQDFKVVFHCFQHCLAPRAASPFIEGLNSNILSGTEKSIPALHWAHSLSPHLFRLSVCINRHH